MLVYVEFYTNKWMCMFKICDTALSETILKWGGVI